MSNLGPRLPRRSRKASSLRKTEAHGRWFWPAIGTSVALVVAAVFVVLSQLGGGGTATGDSGSAITGASTDEPLRVGAIEAHPAKFDLGTVPLNKYVTPTFRLHNVGDKPVTITISDSSTKPLEGC